MTVICDSSPLINLAWIGRLDILHFLYRDVKIAEAVWQEVVINGEGQPGSQEVRIATWIQHKKPANGLFVWSLRHELDAGEAESIALALEEKADLLIIDDKLGREKATYFNIHVVGLIGVLVEAKRTGLIQSMKPLLDDLMHTAHFYINPSLYTHILLNEGEV